MRLYFLLIGADHFHQEITPALAESWRRRHFEPCGALCQRIVSDWPTADFEPARLSLEQLLCSRIAQESVPFDRGLWRLLVGEVLLYSATEMPEIETAPAALARLLDVAANEGPGSREHFHWIEQVHYGTRDLRFGDAFYRPEHAGINDTYDVMRLTNCLAQVQSETWTPGQLAGLPDVLTDEDRADELEYIREWFPALRGLYEQAGQREQVIICETP